jgi:hypothetical protein
MPSRWTQQAIAARLAKRVSKLENKENFKKAFALNTQAIAISRTLRETYPGDATHAMVLWGRLAHQAGILDALGLEDEGRKAAKEAIDLSAYLLEELDRDSPIRVRQDRARRLEGKESMRRRLLGGSDELREFFGL